MVFFLAILAVVSGIISIAFLFYAEKAEEYIDKFWDLILGILFVFFTIYLAENSIEFSKKEKTFANPEYNIYYNY